jgi:quercetin dioxygenase-like cupin family protein
MKASQAAFATATFAFFSLVAPAAWAQGQAEHIMVAPKDLTWADVPSLPPGAKIAVIEGPMNEAKPFTVRLKFPANYKIPAHSHPAIEHVTVISGTLNMGMGDKLDPKQTKALSAGSVAIVQPKTNHFGWTKTQTIVQLHGVGPWGVTYVNPSDDPRKK